MGLSDWLKGASLPKKIAVVVGSGAILCGTAYGVYRFYCSQGEKEIIEEVTEDKANEKRILVLGLDGSGKSTFLSALSQQGHDAAKRQEEAKPTEGFNVMCVSTNGLALNIWEIGGGETFRSYWSNFTLDTDVLIYAVDSNDKERFQEAREALAHILCDENLKDVPVILLATKMDLPYACNLEEIMEELEVSKVTEHRRVNVVGIQVPPVAPEKGIGRAQDVLLELCGNC